VSRSSRLKTGTTKRAVMRWLLVTACKRVYYWGRVQGVGFRYTAYNLAKKYPVTGYVKNMLDGQVELVAEGEARDVDRFLNDLAGAMAGFIKGQTSVDESPQGFADFTIR
jgi:acylphosphatase